MPHELRGALVKDRLTRVEEDRKRLPHAAGTNARPNLASKEKPPGGDVPCLGAYSFNTSFWTAHLFAVRFLFGCVRRTTEEGRMGGWAETPPQFPPIRQSAPPVFRLSG